MRFFKDGPSIPDELLAARDEGRVVFFCGAGVSKARAELPDFLELTHNLIKEFGVPVDNPICKILKKTKELEEETGIKALVSTDRIFGLLEYEFGTHNVESAVAKALKPKPGVDLSAHRILIDLSRTPEGKVRLVTTNFDPLFKNCNSKLKVWTPPKLPDATNAEEMDGIIHLHGRVNKDYSAAEGDGFILTSSEFGRAYLSDGHATAFFKDVIDKYFVVFLGYAADDPPIQYLLEAMQKKEGKLKNVYAFQAGAPSKTDARWIQKGIHAIYYSEENEHYELWKTLQAWAKRARNPDKWHQSVLKLA